MAWNPFRKFPTMSAVMGPPIVADALLATAEVAHGALVPLVIVDSSNRPDIAQVILAHQHLAPGDVETQWAGSLDVRHRVILFIQFVRPVPTQMTLAFDAIEQGALIDSIVHTNLLYLQGGRSGDRLQSTMEAMRILVQVDSESFEPHWERIFRDATFAALRARGLSRPQAKRATQVAIAELRSLTTMRLSGRAK